MYKAGSIMLTGVQPPLTFSLGQLLFPFGTIAIYYMLGGESRLKKLAFWFAIIGIVGTISASLYELLPNARISGQDEFFFPYSLFVLLASVGGFFGLFLIAVRFMRDKQDIGRQRFVPLAVALVPIPLLGTSVFHFEVPIRIIFNEQQRK